MRAIANARNQCRQQLKEKDTMMTGEDDSGTDGGDPGVWGAGSSPLPAGWDFEADVVVIGAGATGLPAALKAVEAGASVIVVEANYDIGGHAILSGGNVPLGGGTSVQRKYGIADSPDLVFADLTDWSIVQPNGWPDYRYNDRAIMRAFADHCAATYEFLVANGVKFKDVPPDNVGAHSTGNSAPRENHAFWTDGTGLGSPSGRDGAGLVRPLEERARGKGVRFLLHYKMTRLIRTASTAVSPGRVVGVTAQYTPRILPGALTPLPSYRSAGNIDCTTPRVSIRAAKAVILATGGSTSNVNFRRMFDPRLTEVYQVAGEPYTFQDASGELAAMAIGASLWGLGNQILENGDGIRTQRALGARYNYFVWDARSPIFPLVRAAGLEVTDWHNLILVNQLGQRFYDETKGDYPNGNRYNECTPYTSGDYRNTARIAYDPTAYNFLNAAVAMNAASAPPDYAAGPIWAIFDADAVAREQWQVTPPHVDPDGYCFSANTLVKLAAVIHNPYQTRPMDGATLQTTVERYNAFVDAGVDGDFGKLSPRYKIQRPPFYAAWATPLVHDTRAGLRINARCQVMDMQGQVIPGLYCGGESAGGFNQHGLGRCVAQGYIAGKNAAMERPQT
jgi:succinate dehydrogenase/fumarate reductase flavoprotein subunit